MNSALSTGIRNPYVHSNYSDVDKKLDGLNKDDYVKELLKICHTDYCKLNDYRERLAERAQAFPTCPQTRLVNRRNSSTGTREEKCASDYYVLYAYNHGIRNREILDVFSNARTTDNDTILIRDDNEKQFIPPELFWYYYTTTVRHDRSQEKTGY